MTEFFLFDELTWPEVAKLPRETPLVIPLGKGYEWDQLAIKLENPPRAGLLPPIPFGWEGSGLSVDENLIAAYLGNLLDGLKEDGFTRVFGLAPPNLSLDGLDGLLYLPGTQTAAAPIPEDSQRGKVVLIPIGHTEQHGFHLPLSTDTLIIEAIAQGVAARAPELAVALPAMPYGVSTHRRAFSGTLNASGRAFEDFWLGVVATLVGRGFDRFYLISGHGGNSSFLVNMVKYAGERHPRIFCATAWLYLSGPDGIASLEKQRKSGIGGMGHACELETSLILHLRPDLVHMEKVVDEVDFITTPAYYMDWVEGGALVANPPWYDDTITGAYGAGSLSSAESGLIWLEAAVTEKMDHIEQIHEQQARREARRKSGFGMYKEAG